MDLERKLRIQPLVQENVAYNTRILSNVRNLSSSVFGIAAGILGLESYYGFLFYAASTMAVSALMFFYLDDRKSLESPWTVWTGDISGGVLSYILTWTLFYNLVN